MEEILGNKNTYVELKRDKTGQIELKINSLVKKGKLGTVQLSQPKIIISTNN